MLVFYSWHTRYKFQIRRVHAIILLVELSSLPKVSFRQWKWIIRERDLFGISINRNINYISFQINISPNKCHSTKYKHQLGKAWNFFCLHCPQVCPVWVSPFLMVRKCFPSWSPDILLSWLKMQIAGPREALLGQQGKTRYLHFNK